MIKIIVSYREGKYYALSGYEVLEAIRLKENDEENYYDDTLHFIVIDITMVDEERNIYCQLNPMNMCFNKH